MRALTHQLMKRPKKEPDPDGLGDYGNSNSGYSHYNNGNLENGNNGGVPAMDMDFHSQPPSLKVEPMDTYERNNGSPAHLNANRPQVGFLCFFTWWGSLLLISTYIRRCSGYSFHLDFHSFG